MVVKPFKGLRANPDLIDKINVPPYDVVEISDIKEFVKNNPYSFFHITRSEIDLSENEDCYSNNVYIKARENLEIFIKNNYLIVDDEPYFYLLTQRYKNKTQIGIYALLSCEEYINNKIKKHELTRKDKEIDRTNHIDIVKADTGPVFLFFEYEPNYEKLKEKLLSLPVVSSFKDEKNVYYELRVIKERDIINEIILYFSNIEFFYIADGHHRAASAINVYKKKINENTDYQNSSYAYFMGVIFPSNELCIYPYNRLLIDDQDISENELINKIKIYFNISNANDFKPVEKGDIRIYFDKKFYKLELKDEFKNFSNVIDSLDTTIVQKYLFSKIFGIDDPRTSNKLKFIGGEESLNKIINLINKNQGKIGISLYPVSINDLIKVSNNDEIMPPKSTWFEPKLRDGVVSYLLEY